MQLPPVVDGEELLNSDGIRFLPWERVLSLWASYYLLHCKLIITSIAFFFLSFLVSDTHGFVAFF